MTSRKFSADVKHLDEVREFVGRTARSAGFDERDIYAVQLAADEAASNIIEHAYAGRADGTFRLHCEYKDDKLVMTFFDQGLSFDFTSVETPDVNASLSDRKIGGLGIYLMHKLMDVVEYRIAEGGNFLTLIKQKK